jgi:hypothetical protein
MLFFLVLPIFLLATFLVFTDYPNGRLARDVHKWIKTPPTKLPDLRTVASTVQSGAANLASAIAEHCDHLGRRLQTAYNTGFVPSSEAGRKVYEIYTVTADKLKPVWSAAQAVAFRAYEACQVLAERIQAEYQQHFPFLKPFDEQNTVEPVKDKKKKASVEVPVFTGVHPSSEGLEKSPKISVKATEEEGIKLEKKDNKINEEKDAQKKKSSSDAKGESAKRQEEKLKNVAGSSQDGVVDKKKKSNPEEKGENNKGKDKKNASKTEERSDKNVRKPVKKDDGLEKEISNGDRKGKMNEKKEEGTKKKEDNTEKKGNKSDKHSQ